MSQESIIQEIRDERQRQDEKYGADRDMNPFFWLAVLECEAGEACGGALTAAGYKDTPEGWANYREEMIQVGAVALAAVESFDRYSVQQGWVTL